MAKKKRKTISALEELQRLLGLESKPLERWLTTRKSHAIKHLQGTESLVEPVFSTCAELLPLIQTDPESISCILESPLKSNWTTFLDKLITLDDLKMLTTLLFKTLAQEFLSNEKAFKPFWTTAYQALSEKLWLPTETGLADLAMTSSRALSTRQVERLPCLRQRKTNLQSRNLQMTSYPLSTSSAAGKWEKENTKNPVKFKTLAVKVQLTLEQKQLYKEHAGCFRYVHNKALEQVKKHGKKKDWQELRNMLVTGDTKLNSNTAEDHKIRIQEQFAVRSAINLNVFQERNLLMRKVHADGGLMESEKEILCDYIKEQGPVCLQYRSNGFLEYMNEINVWIQDGNSRKERQQEIISSYKDLKKQDLKTVCSSKNPNVSDWELGFHKEMRTNAVKKVCASYKTAEANFKAGNIKSYDISYMTSKDPKSCIELDSTQLSVKNKNIHLPSFKGHPTLKVSKKMSKKLNGVQIVSNCDFVHQKNSYWILIPVAVEMPPLDLDNPTYCGVDPGVVKIATTFGKTGFIEYTHNRELLKRYNQKITLLKTKLSVRKKQINKVENRLHRPTSLGADQISVR